MDRREKSVGISDMEKRLEICSLFSTPTAYYAWHILRNQKIKIKQNKWTNKKKGISETNVTWYINYTSILKRRELMKREFIAIDVEVM